jgi:hypothetical protein
LIKVGILTSFQGKKHARVIRSNLEQYSPKDLVSANVQVNPLLLVAHPEDADIWLVPNVPNESLEGMIGLEICHQSSHEEVIV